MNCENTYYNNNNNEGRTDNEPTINGIDINDWRLKPLYLDTEHFCAPKTDADEIVTSDRLLALQFRPQAHPSSVPVILKDTTRPYTYYTVKSYGHAQDNNYYVNFDDHVSSAAPSHHYNHMNMNANTKNNFEMNHAETNNPKQTFENSGCVKTYLCALLGCFACCLFQLKPV